MPDRLPRPRDGLGVLRALLIRLAWLALALLIALGAAGVGTAMQHARHPEPRGADLGRRPGGGARARRRRGGAAGRWPTRWTRSVRRLAGPSRRSWAATGRAPGTIARARPSWRSSRSRPRQVETALDAVPPLGSDPELVVADDCAGAMTSWRRTGLTAGLEADWSAFTGRALDAASLTGLLTRHDRRPRPPRSRARPRTTRPRWYCSTASDATLAEARALAERLARTADVSTLTTWMDRNAAYDVAVRDLYRTLLDATAGSRPGRAAIDAERRPSRPCRRTHAAWW